MTDTINPRGHQKFFFGELVFTIVYLFPRCDGLITTFILEDTSKITIIASVPLSLSNNLEKIETEECILGRTEKKVPK